MVHVEKLRGLVLAIARHPSVRSLGLTKLWKLIYFVDVEALRDYGNSITGSEFIKYPHGPVPSRGERVLKAMRKSGELRTEQRQQDGYAQTLVIALAAVPDVFSAAERTVIDHVCRRLGGKTAKALSHLSHEEPAWALATELDKLDPELLHYGKATDPEGL